MTDMESVFLSPNFVLTNRETGKTFFEMKRKTPTEDSCYYLFKVYDENMPNEAVRAKVHGIFTMAATMNIGMFNFDEVSEKTAERVKEILQSGGQLSEEQIDVSIEVFDHAAQELDRLIVGISTEPMEERSR